MPIHKQCETCGTEFFVPPSRASARYCSVKCSARNGAANHKWKGGLHQYNCLYCGKPSLVKPSHIKKGEGKFCSASCKAKAQSVKRIADCIAKRIIKNCVVCNSIISVKPSHANNEGTYCSIDCMAEGYKTRLAGKENPNYRHGNGNEHSFYNNMRRNAEGTYSASDISNLVKNQKNKCANCGVCFSKVKMHIDHIVPVVKGGSNWPSNLQLLCASCNCKKNAKDPFVWANENGKLL